MSDCRASWSRVALGLTLCGLVGCDPSASGLFEDASSGDAAIRKIGVADAGDADGHALAPDVRPIDASEISDAPTPNPDLDLPPDSASVDPDAGPTVLEIRGLTAVPAKGAIGLEWLAQGSLDYTLYWTDQPDASPLEGEAIEGVLPGFIHGALSDAVTYRYVVGAVDGEKVYESLLVEARPGGEFVLHHLGAGNVDLLASPGSVNVPLKDRIHTLILPEGYLQAELDAGTFAQDVDTWFEQTFVIEPYSTFSDAFVVWSRPVASAEHVASGHPQTNDTALLIPLTDDGSGVSSEDFPLDGPTALRVWDLLADFPYAPAVFYPPGGRTSRLAKNLVVAALVLDPALGRSGHSGQTRGLQNPANGEERISVAVAHNLPHEFSHAFARLLDEYLEEDNVDVAADNNSAPLASSGIANVVRDEDCDRLPWAHLLQGGLHNPAIPGLVGAFGVDSLGYHSELLCLMNGRHDNATYYGGDGDLRVYDRFCNFCRELVTFRIYERAGLLPEPATSLADWIELYRAPFYDEHGFSAPEVIPQRNSDGEAIYEACAE